MLGNALAAENRGCTGPAKRLVYRVIELVP
jgi:hypothetical protein